MIFKDKDLVDLFLEETNFLYGMEKRRELTVENYISISESYIFLKWRLGKSLKEFAKVAGLYSLLKKLKTKKK